MGGTSSVLSRAPGLDDLRFGMLIHPDPACNGLRRAY